VSLQARCVAKVKEKYFTAKYTPVGVLLKCLRYDLFKIKLQLKYRKNKIYSYLTVSFDTGLHLKKYVNVHIKFGTVKNYHEMRSLVHGHVSVAITMSTSFRSRLWNHFILDPFRSNALIILVLFFPNRLHRRIYETKLPTHVSFPFSPVFYFSYYFNP